MTPLLRLCCACLFPLTSNTGSSPTSLHGNNSAVCTTDNTPNAPLLASRSDNKNQSNHRPPSYHTAIAGTTDRQGLQENDNSSKTNEPTTVGRILKRKKHSNHTPFSGSLHALFNDNRGDYRSALATIGNTLPRCFNWISDVFSQKSAAYMAGTISAAPNEAFFYATTFFYRFILLKKGQVAISNLQLYLCASMMLALDILDEAFSRTSTYEEMSRVTNKSYTVEIIEKSHIEIIKTLNWNILKVNNLYTLYITSNLYPAHTLTEHVQYTMYLQLVMMDYRHVYWPPKHILHCLEKQLYPERGTEPLLVDPAEKKWQYDCEQWLKEMIRTIPLTVPAVLSSTDNQVQLQRYGFSEEKIESLLRIPLETLINDDSRERRRSKRDSCFVP